MCTSTGCTHWTVKHPRGPGPKRNHHSTDPTRHSAPLGVARRATGTLQCFAPPRSRARLPLARARVSGQSLELSSKQGVEWGEWGEGHHPCIPSPTNSTYITWRSHTPHPARRGRHGNGTAAGVPWSCGLCACSCRAAFMLAEPATGYQRLRYGGTLAWVCTHACAVRLSPGLQLQLLKRARDREFSRWRPCVARL